MFRAVAKFTLLSVLAWLAVPMAEVAMVTGGSSTISLDMTALGGSTGITTLDAVFGGTETRAECLSGVGITPFDPANLSFPVNPTSVVSPAGRTAQASELDFDSADVLGTWAAGNYSSGFLDDTGEQIGLEGMLRLRGAFPGSLLLGDFALRYDPTRVGTVRNGNTLSGLILTSNIDFSDAAFADIANATITANGSQLSVSGDLVISNALALLVSGNPNDATLLGVDIGNFSLTAIPEPSSVVLVGLAVAGLGWAASRRLRQRVDRR